MYRQDLENIGYKKIPCAGDFEIFSKEVERQIIIKGNRASICEKMGPYWGVEVPFISEEEGILRDFKINSRESSWEKMGNSGRMWKCKVCSGAFEKKYRYCPDCGRRMRGRWE